MKIYTRSGDSGSTSLFGGERVRKDHPRIEAYGTIDELNSAIGVARAAWPSSPIDHELHRIQSDLFEIGAFLAAPGSDSFPGPAKSRPEELEKGIDTMEEDLPPLRNFILPAGSPGAASLHLARTICRRAERLVVALDERDPGMTDVVVYLNRLSDYLFVAARFSNRKQWAPEIEWNRRAGA